VVRFIVIETSCGAEELELMGLFPIFIPYKTVKCVTLCVCACVCMYRLDNKVERKAGINSANNTRLLLFFSKKVALPNYPWGGVGRKGATGGVKGGWSPPPP